MIRVLIVYAVLLFVAPGCAQSSSELESDIPLTVSNVEVTRVNGVLVRVILHNTVLEPRVDFELITTPDRALVDRVRVEGVDVGDEYLDFHDSADIDLRDIRVSEQGVTFNGIYTHTRPSGRTDFSCSLPIRPEGFGAMDCMQVETGTFVD